MTIELAGTYEQISSKAYEHPPIAPRPRHCTRFPCLTRSSNASPTSTTSAGCDRSSSETPSDSARIKYLTSGGATSSPRRFSTFRRYRASTSSTIPRSMR